MERRIRLHQPNSKNLHKAISIAVVTIIVTMSFYPSISKTSGKADAAISPNFSFAAAGDIGCTSAANTVLNLIDQKNPDVILGLGDYAHEVTFTCFYNQLTAHPSIEDKLHVILGNHDSSTCTDCPAGTFPSSQEESNFKTRFGLNPTYYSFEYNGVHFLMLDSVEEKTSSNQFNFASADLASASANPSINWIITAIHHPEYRSCSDKGCSYGGGNDTTMRTKYQSLFDKYGVSMILSGHMHAYERSKPLQYNSIVTSIDTNDYVNQKGEVFAIAGTGGADSLMNSFASHPKFSAVQVAQRYGFLHVTVTPTALLAKFIDSTNTVRDTFAIVKNSDLQSVSPEPGAITDVFAQNVNSADYVNSYQQKVGMKITDANRFGKSLDVATFSLHKPSETTNAQGSLRAVLIKVSDSSVIATSTNSISRSAITAGYKEYAFQFGTNAITPSSNFFVGLECVSCNDAKVFVGIDKVSNPYASGQERIRTSQWSDKAADLVGSAVYG